MGLQWDSTSAVCSGKKMGLQWDSTSAVYSSKKIYSGRTEVLYNILLNLVYPWH